MKTSGDFAVAITGHRPNRIQVGEHVIARRIGWVLATLRSVAYGKHLVALSPLAEGSGRLFAAMALQLPYELLAVLPFRTAAYETTFSDPGAALVYRNHFKSGGQRD